MQLKL